LCVRLLSTVRDEKKNCNQNNPVNNRPTKENIVENQKHKELTCEEKEAMESISEKETLSRKLLADGSTNDTEPNVSIRALIEKACVQKEGNIMLYLSDRNLTMETCLLEIIYESQEKTTIKKAEKGLVLYFININSVI